MPTPRDNSNSLVHKYIKLRPELNKPRCTPLRVRFGPKDDNFRHLMQTMRT